MMDVNEINSRLKDNGLKITPQRIAVLESLLGNRSHPNAEYLIEKIHLKHPNISVGTIYNILETFVSKGIIVKVMTQNNIMRYDPVIKKHHHIFFSNNEEIIDYFDEDLTELVFNYLKKTKNISEIEIESININIIGKKLLK